MNFIEPLDVYFVDAAFDATLNGSPLRVIFDDAYQEGLGIIEGVNPQVFVKATDVAGVQHGALLVISFPTGAQSFTVREVQPDVNGMVTLQLRAV